MASLLYMGAATATDVIRVMVNAKEHKQFMARC